MLHPRLLALALLTVAAASSQPLSAQTAPERRDDVRGTVLVNDAVAGALIQTARGIVTLPPATAATLRAGDRIDARGTLAERAGETILTDAVITNRTSGSVPPPVQTTAAALGTASADWVEVDTVIYDAIDQSGRLELTLPSPVWPTSAGAPRGQVAPQQLIDAKVRLRGVRRLTRNPQGAVIGVRLIAMPIDPAAVLEPAPASPFDHPAVTAAEYRRIAFQQSREHRLRLRGTVLMRHQAFIPGRRVIHVQDETGGLTAEVLDDSGITDGDRVDISGFPAVFFGTPIIASGVVRREGAGAIPPAIEATMTELLSGAVPRSFVTVTATYVEGTKGAGADVLTLESEGTPITAYVFETPGRPAMPALRPGSAVEITGVFEAIPGPDGKPAIIMTLRNPEAIHIASSPSWWTPARITTAILVSALLLIMSFAWVWVLNARVRSRTRAFEEQYRRATALQQQWMDLVATASDIILTWDLDGRILSANHATETLTGLLEDQLRHRPLLELTTPASQAAVEALLEPHGPDGSTRTAVIDLTTPDGHAVPVEVIVQPVLDDAHQQIGWLAIGRNIAVQRRTERALRAARDAAEDASRAKSEFLANMSHEIRTPMNGIIGMTELALTTELTETQREYLQTVKASSESLLGLLNSILDFSKIESRKLELESVPFALREVIAETLKPLAFKADEKGLELVCEIAPDVPDALVGDPLRLRQITTNLVSNAIKFTERGHVHVAIRQERHANGCTRLQFSISDTGPGIPTEKHATIFEPFSQADGSTTRRYGGTGLGLAISATLVRLMGGRIWVDSLPGNGSTFHFTAGFDVTTAVEPAHVEPLLANLPVLVVDDNAINRRILAEQLARWGMRASLADGGHSAIAALDAAAAAGEPFLLVLLDANMPELDGFAVAEHIYAQPALAGATIMMLTSSGQAGDAERCRLLNVAAYLTKPIVPRHLFEAICRVVGKGRTQAAALTRPAKPLAVAERASRRRVLLAEDNIVNQRVAIGLLTKRGHDVTLAANGREALAALERGTFDIVLMDVQMPEMGGLEATEEIRRRETGTGRRIRIVAMTAHAMNGDREQCLAAGMDGYLSKPVNPAMLYAVVEQETDAAAGTAPPAPARARGTIDSAELKERLNGDEELFGEVIEAFLEDCPERLAAIRTAIDRHDAEALRRAAHTLKGAAGNLSAQSLFEAALGLEELAKSGRSDAWEAAWRELTVEAAHVMDTLRRCEPVRRSYSEAAGASRVSSNTSEPASTGLAK